MAQRRHWKQHWDPTAPLVFIRRMKMQHGDREFVNPGDRVTQEVRDAIGRTEAHQLARLKRWWAAGFLAIEGWQAPSEIQRAKHERGLPRLTLMDVGKSRYLVYGPKAGVIDCEVRGRAKAEAVLARLVAADKAAQEAAAAEAEAKAAAAAETPAPVVTPEV